MGKVVHAGGFADDDVIIHWGGLGEHLHKTVVRSPKERRSVPIFQLWEMHCRFKIARQQEPTGNHDKREHLKV